MSVDDQGRSVLAYPQGTVTQSAPVVYQEVNGQRVTVRSRFLAVGLNQVGFQVVGREDSRPLVIDPIVVYATYLGGNGSENAWDVAADAAGSAYVTGDTAALDFPVLNAAQGTNGGTSGTDAFVSKFNPTASALVYSTFYGGTQSDASYSIRVDAFGNAYFGGTAR